MIIKNVKVYTEEQKFVPGEIVVLGDRITEVRADGEKRQTAAEALETESSVNGFPEDEEAEEVVVDGEGAYAIPGLIDLHFHGCVGADVCDGTPEALKKIAQYEASVGVTAIAPATMTLPVEELEQILRNAAAYKRAQDEHRAANAAAGQSVQRAEQKDSVVAELKEKKKETNRIVVIGDRSGDRLFINLSPLETLMNKWIQNIGDRLIEKMMFFY